MTIPDLPIRSFCSHHRWEIQCRRHRVVIRRRHRDEVNGEVGAEQQQQQVEW